MKKKWMTGLIIVGVVIIFGLSMMFFSCSTEPAESCVSFGNRCNSTSDCCDGLICDDEGQLPGIYVCQ
jgi:hypothetical protein